MSCTIAWRGSGGNQGQDSRSHPKEIRMQARLWLTAGLTCGVLLFLQTLALAAEEGTSEDTAEVLRRQTQEMIDAVTTGSAAVWERYLDAKAVYTAEDGTVQTKAQLVEQIKPLPVPGDRHLAEDCRRLAPDRRPGARLAHRPAGRPVHGPPDGGVRRALCPDPGDQL